MDWGCGTWPCRCCTAAACHQRWAQGDAQCRLATQSVRLHLRKTRHPGHCAQTATPSACHHGVRGEHILQHLRCPAAEIEHGPRRIRARAADDGWSALDDRTQPSMASRRKERATQELCADKGRYICRVRQPHARNGTPCLLCPPENDAQGCCGCMAQAEKGSEHECGVCRCACGSRCALIKGKRRLRSADQARQHRQ